MKVANTTYRAGGRAVLVALALSALGFAGSAYADSDERRGWYAPEHRGGWVHVGERRWHHDRDYRGGYRDGWRDGRRHERWRDDRRHWRDDRRHWRGHDRRWRDDRRYWSRYDRGYYAPRHGYHDRYWKPGHYERWPRRWHDDGEVSLVIRVPF